MERKISFCPEFAELGRVAIGELVRTDVGYGPGYSFDSVGGHGLENHHGGMHTQLNLYNAGVSGEGLAIRVFEK